MLASVILKVGYFVQGFTFLLICFLHTTCQIVLSCLIL